MFPDDLKYTPEHEWVRVNPSGTVTFGITDFAQRLNYQRGLEGELVDAAAQAVAEGAEDGEGTDAEDE